MWKGVLVTLLVLLVVATIVFTLTPWGVSVMNSWGFSLQKADDATNYDTIKKVEDTCRAMIASYEKDKLTYLQYKDSAKENEQEWAQQAKMRANQTASTYNNYVRDNSFVWKGNIPLDINGDLPYLE